MQPLLKYLPKDRIIWCPFDEEWSAFYRTLKDNGYNVVRSSLSEGRDFFVYEPDEWDIAVSNPPFSVKDRVLKRLYELNKPFAVLLPLNSLQGKERYDFFRRGVQLLAFDKRIAYHVGHNYEAYTKFEREKNTNLMNTMDGIFNLSSAENDMKRDNANTNTDTAMGTMLKVGSEASKDYYLKHVLKKEYADAHQSGLIHIHDLDFYNLTTTCCQIDLEKLLKGGFSTGNGSIRPPTSIRSAAALVAIVLQSNQNDQHGGQSIANFDYDLAPYVALTYIDKLIGTTDVVYNLSITQKQELKCKLRGLYDKNKTIYDNDIEVSNIISSIVGDSK